MASPLMQRFQRFTKALPNYNVTTDLTAKDFLFPMSAMFASGFLMFKLYTRHNTDPNYVFWHEYETETARGRKDKDRSLEALFVTFVAESKNEVPTFVTDVCKEAFHIEHYGSLFGIGLGMALGWKGKLGFDKLRVGGMRTIAALGGAGLLSTVFAYTFPRVKLRNQTEEMSREANAKFLEFIREHVKKPVDPTK